MFLGNLRSDIYYRATGGFEPHSCNTVCLVNGQNTEDDNFSALSVCHMMNKVQNHTTYYKIRHTIFSFKIRHTIFSFCMMTGSFPWSKANCWCSIFHLIAFPNLLVFHNCYPQRFTIHVEPLFFSSFWSVGARAVLPILYAVWLHCPARRETQNDESEI